MGKRFSSRKYLFYSPGLVERVSLMIKAPVIVLKEGTDTSQGIGQLVSNITACNILVDTIKTTLGPRGMDKLMVAGNKPALITNDGATIMKNLDVIHPAARILVDIARAQDAEVGDGTTSVVVLAGEILKSVKPFVEEGLAPQVIIRSMRMGLEQAFKVLDGLKKELNAKDREMLIKCAGTAMNSKLIHHQRGFFSKMVVDAVLTLDQDSLDTVKMIGMKRVTGGALEDSELINGVAFEKTFAYAGFEQQPKSFKNPKILLLNIELELKAERDNAEVRIDKVSEYQAIVDAEWRILYEKLESIANSGASVVLSRLPIGDVATQYFADRNIFCAGRVQVDDLERVSAAVGGSVLTTLSDLSSLSLFGTCGTFEERQVGGKRMNVFAECPLAKTCTLVLRGGSDQFLAEVERSLNDAILIVKRAVKSQFLIAGGGAVEMEIAAGVRKAAFSIPGTAQSIMCAFAQAFECIPRQLCENAGLDPTDTLAHLRKAHANGQKWHGVDVNSGAADMWEAGVWEPSIVKRNMIGSATEAAIAILSVDLTVKSAPPAQADNLGKMARRAGLQ